MEPVAAAMAGMPFPLKMTPTVTMEHDLSPTLTRRPHPQPRRLGRYLEELDGGQACHGGSGGGDGWDALPPKHDPDPEY